MTKGLIADIQRASLHDGAGIRTTVFLKGCPMSCLWCHNPECISFAPEVLAYPEKCIGCGRCAEGCFSGARVVCGREMTAEEVFAEIAPDVPYFFDDGGVTISGGEPLAQPAFTKELITVCKAHGVKCAIETALIRYEEEIFKSLDFIMADLKLWDEGLHKQYTGVSNREILAHFKRLDQLGIPIIARTPVIPGIEQGIDQISAFLKRLVHVTRYELLPYHPLGNGKAAALGREIATFAVPTAEVMKELKKYAFVRR